MKPVLFSVHTFISIEFESHIFTVVLTNGENEIEKITRVFEAIFQDSWNLFRLAFVNKDRNNISPEKYT